MGEQERVVEGVVERERGTGLETDRVERELRSALRWHERMTLEPTRRLRGDALYVGHPGGHGETIRGPRRTIDG